MDKQLDEILTILQEECAEVIQAVSKMRRFGRFGVDLSTGATNTFHLQKELGDVLAMIELLDSHEYVDIRHIHLIKHEKFDKLRVWSNINVDYNKLKNLTE